MKNLIEKLRTPKGMLTALVIIFVLAAVSFIAMEKASARPAFCVSCHNMEPEYKTYVEGNLLAKKHADAGVTCHDCHEPSVAQQMDEGIKFVTGNYVEPMPKYSYDNGQCLKCHDFEAVKQATAKYGPENPHDSTHAEGGAETPECASCHSVHHKQSPKACMSCHGVSWELDDSWEMPVHQ